MNSILLLLTFPAASFLQRGLYPEATRLYRLETALHPTPDNAYGRGICELLAGSPEAAAECLLPLTVDHRYRTYYLGIAAYRSGRTTQAESLFALCHRRPEIARPARLYQALIALRRDDINAARAHVAAAPGVPPAEELAVMLADVARLIAARNYYAAGEYQEALAQYDAVDSFAPYRAIGKAMTLSRLGDRRRCTKILDSLLETAVPQEVELTALLHASACHLELGEHPAARAHLRRYLAIEDGQEAHFLLGLVHAAENEMDSAAAHFRLLPDTVDQYLFFQGRTDYFRGNWGGAEEKLLRHREFFPGSTYADRAIFIIGSINFKRSEFRCAIEFFTDLLTLYPQSSLAARGAALIADAYFELKEYRSASEAYARVADYHPPRDLAEEIELKHYETEFHLGQYPTLIDALRRFIANHPRHALVPQAHLRIARLHIAQREYWLGLGELEHLCGQYPDHPVVNDALFERARTYAQIGDEKELIQSLHQLLDRRQAAAFHPFAANELALIHARRGALDSTLFYYNRLLEFREHREMAMLEIARTYDELGRVSEAEMMIDQLLRDYPASEHAADACLLKARIRRLAGDGPGAIRLLEELIGRFGPRPEYYMELGAIAYATHDYRNARDHFLTACELFKQHRDDAASALMSAGDAALALGDKEQARSLYLQANLMAQSPAQKGMAGARLAQLDPE